MSTKACHQADGPPCIASSSHPPRLVRPVEEPVLQQEHGPVRDERVPLHLPEAHAAAPPPPLDGLPRHLVHRPHRPHLELVAHHVAQPLVVDDPEEDVGLNEE